MHFWNHRRIKISVGRCQSDSEAAFHRSWRKMGVGKLAVPDRLGRDAPGPRHAIPPGVKKWVRPKYFFIKSAHRRGKGRSILCWPRIRKTVAEVRLRLRGANNPKLRTEWQSRSVPNTAE